MLSFLKLQEGFNKKRKNCFLYVYTSQHEATASEPLDELYDALAQVMGAGEGTVCYKTYFLVSNNDGIAFQYITS